MMRDSELEQLVVQYLKRRKLGSTLATFTREAEQVRAPAQVPADGDSGLAVALLAGCAALDAPPQQYLDSFDALLRFVDASLDLYRPELQRVVYPVFVHTYLALVALGAASAASDLLRAHGDAMTDAGGRRSAARAQEVSQLRAVGLPQHLETNAFAKSALDKAARVVVRMCPYSFELLMHFLRGGRHWLLLGVINERLRMELYEGEPVALDPEAAAAEAEAGLLHGHAAESAATINASKLLLGLLKDPWNLEDAYAAAKLQLEEEAEKAAAAAAAAAPAAAAADGVALTSAETLAAAAAATAGVVEAPAGGGAGGEKLTKRARAARDRAAAAVKARRKELEDSRIDPRIPLIPFSDAARRAAFEDIEARATVGPSDLPSCCFFTLTNTRQSCCSLTFDPAVKYAAAGFADSSVRLFNLHSLGGARRAQAKQAQRRAERRAAARGAGGAEAMEADGDDEPEEEEELEDLSDRAVLPLYGHTAPVCGVDFFSDGALLLSASADATVRVWSPELRRGLAAYHGHAFPVWAVAACPHGGYFASGGADRTARIWTTEVNARPLRVLAGHQSDVDVVAWHPNSHYLATGSADRSVRLWDVRRGRAARALAGAGGAGGVTALAFAPDGRHLAAGSEDGTIGVYDLATAKRVASVEGHAGPVWSLAFSRGTGDLLASGGADNSLRLWSAPRADNCMVSLVAEARAAAATGSGASAARPSEDGGGGGGGTGQQQQQQGQQQQQQQQQHKPYSQLKSYRTRATPVTQVAFSPRNLLLAGGAWAPRPLRKA